MDKINLIFLKYYDIISDILLTEKNSKKSNKKHRYRLNSTKCEICLEKFDNKNNNNYFKLKLCGHKFCVECLKMHICESLNLTSGNSIPIKCPKCKTKFDPDSKEECIEMDIKTSSKNIL